MLFNAQVICQMFQCPQKCFHRQFVRTRVQARAVPELIVLLRASQWGASARHPTAPHFPFPFADCWGEAGFSQVVPRSAFV